MKKNYKLTIAKKIKNNQNLTVDEQKFVNEYMKKFLNECEII
jgi:hypothetical protein